MNLGLWASIIVGVGVAGHAVVGAVLTTRLAGPTRRLWRPFGPRRSLVRLNGTLLIIASALHLGISVAKSYDAGWTVLVTSILPFVAFGAAGIEERGRVGRGHHLWMAMGWITFALHGLVATS